MTNVKIQFDPYRKEVNIYYDDQLIISENNKLISYISTNGFIASLGPSRTRYTVWHGLLPELIIEMNDDELNIIFEGTEEFFIRTEAAFCESHNIISNMGYDNRWKLSFVEKYDTLDSLNQLSEIASSLKELCDTRQELQQINEFLDRIKVRPPEESYRILCLILEAHQEKWEASKSKYKSANVNYIQMFRTRLENLKPYLTSFQGKEIVTV